MRERSEKNERWRFFPVNFHFNNYISTLQCLRISFSQNRILFDRINECLFTIFLSLFSLSKYFCFEGFSFVFFVAFCNRNHLLMREQWNSFFCCGVRCFKMNNLWVGFSCTCNVNARYNEKWIDLILRWYSYEIVRLGEEILNFKIWRFLFLYFQKIMIIFNVFFLWCDEDFISSL